MVAFKVPVSPTTKVFSFESNVIPVTGISGAFTVTLHVNINSVPSTVTVNVIVVVPFASPVTFSIPN